MRSAELDGRETVSTGSRMGFRRAAASLCWLSLLAFTPAFPSAAAGPHDEEDDHSKVGHVLLVSVDGMHQSDLAWYVQTHPGSTLAALMARGVNYSDASAPFPSDSFPGMVGPATGGNPSTTPITDSVGQEFARLFHWKSQSG